jgi:ATP-dependent RNA helicase DeaD
MTTELIPTPPSSFDDGAFLKLGLSPALAAAVSALGYEEPTDIQREAIPPLLAGRDVLGQAATGTGKTAAFALPLLQRIGSSDDGAQKIRGLILVPTRELAMQVAEAVHKYGRPLGVRVLPIYGGQAMQQQLRALKRGVDVVVATPGRALDHIRRGTLALDAVQMLVLDEADEMLDMGFAEDLEAILSAVPTERQTALFSATMAAAIRTIASRHLREPVRVTIAREHLAQGETPRVREVAYIVQRRHKVAALARVLDMEAPTSIIVFCRTRTEVDELTETLGGRGYRAASAMVHRSCSSRPTSPHAASTSSMSRMSSTSTFRNRRTHTSIVLAVRDALVAKASRSRSPRRASIGCYATSSR